MFERWTDRARRSVILAQEEARMLNHNYVGTEHLLLGLVHEGEAVAAQALSALGVTLEPARQQVEGIIGRGQQFPAGHLPFTPRCKKVCELALREALSLGHTYIGTEHLLLGLVREGEGVAVHVLIKLGVPPDDVRPKVLELLRGYGDLPASQPKPVATLSAAPTLADVLTAIEGVATRLAAIERHLGVAEAAALPEFREEDLQVNVCRPAVPEATGAMCSVRITHLPTGITVTKESRSGLQAKTDALEELRSRVATVQSGTPETHTRSDEKDSTHA